MANINKVTDVEHLMAELGKAQRERDKLKEAMNEKIEQIKQQYNKAAEPYIATIAKLVDEIFVYAEKHKSELIKDAGKSVKLEHGSFGWRTNPPKVSIKNQNAVLERIRAMGLNQFIRIKEEINKEAMLNQIDVAVGIPGVSIIQTEQFWVKPCETDLEEIAG